MSYRSLHKLGLAAAAARQGGAVAGDASWFEAPSTRSARVMEVDGRISQYGRQLDLSNAHEVQPGLLTQWLDFRRQWEDWVSNLSVAAMVLPSTEEWADRQEQQLERFRQAFKDGGVTDSGKPLDDAGGMAMPRVPGPGEKPAADDSWKYIAAALLATVLVGGAVLYYARPTVIKQGTAIP